MLEGNTGPDSHPGPPHPTDVPEATSEHSSEGTSTEDSHPVRREHRLCVGHGAMITHPANWGWDGQTQQVLPPCNPLLLHCLQKHCRFVCQQMLPASDVIKQTFPHKTGTRLQPLTAPQQSSPLQDGTPWAAEGQPGGTMLGNEGLASNMRFYRIPAHSRPFPFPSTSHHPHTR